VRPHDGQRQPLGQFARAARMVDVGVGQPDLVEREAQALHFRQQHVEVTAGVNDGGFARGVAPEDGAVLLESGDGDGEVVEHGWGLFVATKDWLLLTESGQVVNKEWRVPHQTHFSAFSIVPDLRGLHTPL